MALAQSLSQSLAQAISAKRGWRNNQFDFSSARTSANDAGQGFYESSFDLREGLEVIEDIRQPLGEELEREFRRLAAR